MAWKVSVSGRWRNGLVPADAGIWCSGRNSIYVFYHSVALEFIWNNRTPRKEMLHKMAVVLDVDPRNISIPTGYREVEYAKTLFLK
jgi:hypothetical protein